MLVKILLHLPLQIILVCCSEQLLIASDVDAAVIQANLEERFPFLQRTCSKDALSHFIPQCSSSNGIENIPEDVKVEAAISLSVCEFENAGVGYLIPQSCLHSSYGNIMECIMNKDIKTDWWTTYSGYYQKLGEICHQYALVFQKKEIIGMFVNLTDMVNQTNEDWVIKHEESMYESDVVFRDFMEDITRFFGDTFDGFREEANSLRMSVVEQNEMALKRMGDAQVIALQEMEASNSEILGSLDHIRDSAESIAHVFESSNLVNDVHRLNEVKDYAMEVSVRSSEAMAATLEDVSQRLDSFLVQMFSSLTTAQDDTALSIREFNSIVSTSLNNDLLDMKEQIIGDWTVLTDIILGEMHNWNAEVMDHFDMVDKRLNNTLSTVDSLQRSYAQLSRIFSIFLNPLLLIHWCVKHVWVPGVAYLLYHFGWDSYGHLFNILPIAVSVLVGKHVAVLLARANT